LGRPGFAGQAAAVQDGDERGAEEVNARPRKTLDWARPIDLLTRQLAATA